MIDLTAATTPTSVVQARGRALRLDAGWPGKVADNWSVVCVTGDHPKGAADFDRFARKHDRYFALAQTGTSSQAWPTWTRGCRPTPRHRRISSTR